jgi:hypothetical protein
MWADRPSDHQAQCTRGVGGERSGERNRWPDWTRDRGIPSPGRRASLALPQEPRLRADRPSRGPQTQSIRHQDGQRTGDGAGHPAGPRPVASCLVPMAKHPSRGHTGPNLRVNRPQAGPRPVRRARCGLPTRSRFGLSVNPAVRGHRRSSTPLPPTVLDRAAPHTHPATVPGSPQPSRAPRPGPQSGTAAFATRGAAVLTESADSGPIIII